MPPSIPSPVILIGRTGRGNFTSGIRPDQRGGECDGDCLSGGKAEAVCHWNKSRSRCGRDAYSCRSCRTNGGNNGRLRVCAPINPNRLARRKIRYAGDVLAQSSYLSVNDRRLHFGLGAKPKASLDISWPNGRKEHVADVTSDQLVVVREGSGIICRESFGRKK